MANDTKKEKKNKKDKRHFWKDFKVELKKVIWPTPKQLVNSTVAVITIVLITAIIVFALDFVFENLNKYGIDNLKNALESTSQSTENEAEETNNAEETVTDEGEQNPTTENNVEE